MQVVLKVRDEENSFHEIWSTVVDPDSRFVNPVDRPPLGEVWALQENGPPSKKVDLLVIGEGYTEAELPKFHADARRLVDALFEEEPFLSRRSDFNVWGLDLPAGESGVSRPRCAGVPPHAAVVRVQTSSIPSVTCLTYDNRALRDAASAAPYEFLEIVVNEAQYGGGGSSTSRPRRRPTPASRVRVHTRIRPPLRRAGGEYYTSDVAYETGGAYHPERGSRTSPRCTTPARLKWGDLVEEGTPLPTPWDKAAFEAGSTAAQAERRTLRGEGAPETEIDRLFNAQMERETTTLANMTYAGKGRCFRGRVVRADGLYRSEIDCIMFTRNPVGFCRVCRRAINRVIDQYSRP